MTGYIPPLDDMRFVMAHLVDLRSILATPDREDLSEDLVDAVLNEAGRFASGVLAPLNEVGDRVGSQLVDGRVRMPPGFREAYERYVEAGWGALGAPSAHGGQGLPHVVTAAVGEMWKAANLAFSANFLLTTGAVEALVQNGSPEQRGRYLPHMVSGQWCGVMNLTEPQAGSDLAAIRTRAEPQADGSYRLFGQKCFITYADHDMAENIVHLVLARLPDAPPGVKGISMFLVSQRHVNSDGSLGERNDVRVVALEKKLGQHASPTCVVIHGEESGSRAELVGAPGAGLAYIFVMVNAARLGVALEGLGIAERACQQAEAFAQSRVQGRLAGSAESVPIARHPDVRRMLLTMRSQTEAMRAVAYVVAGWLDLAKSHADAETRQEYQDLVDLMIPVLKGWMTETGADVASMALQVHGGAGYIEETGVAQHLRDVRVTAIYEGTTGIQAADLVGRKIARVPGPAALGRLQSAMASTLEELSALKGNVDIDAIAASFSGAVAALNAASDAVITHIDDLPSVLEVSVPYLKLLGVVVGGWQLARSAAVVCRRSAEPESNHAFDAAKLRSACHYALHILPAALGLGYTVQQQCKQRSPAG